MSRVPQITYTATNRAHHYTYAAALHRRGALYAFVSGFSRLSPRAALPEIGERMKKHDFVQTLYVLSDRAKLHAGLVSFLEETAHKALDRASYKWAVESEVFLYYRLTGHRTAQRLHRERAATLCVLEEVNTHVSFFHEILREEYEKLGVGRYPVREDAYRRLLQAYEQADYILCPSSFVVRSFVAKGVSPDKLIMVNFGFNRPTGMEASSPRGASDDIFRILYVGQLHYRKGLRYAVEAFRRLKHPRKEFVIVGPTTPITGLEKTAIPEGVRFTGALKGEELAQAYRSASIFVLPTLEDGSALVQGEAMATGLPIVTTSHSGSDEFIADGVEGFVVPPADSGALAEAFTKLADSHDLREQMSMSAHRSVARLGGWDEAAATLTAKLGQKLARRNSK